MVFGITDLEFFWTNHFYGTWFKHHIHNVWNKPFRRCLVTPTSNVILGQTISMVFGNTHLIILGQTISMVFVNNEIVIIRTNHFDCLYILGNTDIVILGQIILTVFGNTDVVIFRSNHFDCTLQHRPYDS
jgi:hypothetical protein